VTDLGSDAVLIYTLDDTGRLRPWGGPRDLVVTPDGRHVIVACQDSDLLATYRFDDDSGRLSIL